jgi:hypothetical protein
VRAVAGVKLALAALGLACLLERVAAGPARSPAPRGVAAVMGGR